ncbi:hypothetical protein ACEWY4_028007 [Coilia grayii]|uniref:Immunoglobulin domain-containing protein n=1 Tax=Coilia grayii TaxID=363190 RepID=A0ABD1IN14_9TELE
MLCLGCNGKSLFECFYPSLMAFNLKVLIQASQKRTAQRGCDPCAYLSYDLVMGQFISAPPKPTAPRLNDQIVKKGQNITFSWEADYEVNGKWKKDGQTLRDGGRIRIEQLSDPKCFKLTITNAEENDEGEYTLELENRAGKASGSAKVSVLVPPKPTAPKLKDQPVKIGQNITFSWEADYEVNGKWKKDGQTLRDGGRIKIEQLADPNCFKLTITNAEENDEGEYTLELWNSEGKESGSAKVNILEYNTAWRHISWGENEERKTFLMQYKPSNEKAEHLHFLLCGSVGSGKSSIINTISSAFQKRPVVKATAGAAISLDQSQTTDYKTYQIKDNEGTVLPFVFSDTMGLENEEDAGVNTSDIIRALKGELEEGYMRRWSSHSSMEKPPLRRWSSHSSMEKPPLFKKAHCLVNVIAANKIPLLRESENIIKKMHEVRKAASKLGIPQVVFMTHVDLCCPLVQEDLKNIFLSKEIKEIVRFMYFNNMCVCVCLQNIFFR